MLILLPEIALTQAVIARVAARFGAAARRVALRRRPAGAPAGLGGGGRRAAAASWSAPARRCSCRSASCSLIVVDEEHDGSFKQEEGFIYHARDLAVARGQDRGRRRGPGLGHAVAGDPAQRRDRPLPLAAAGRPARRPRGCRTSTSIDLRETPPEAGRWLSPPLVAAMGETWARGEQTPAVPQPPGLCAAGAVPGLRRADDRAGHRLLAGRAPLHRPPGLPPDRLLHAQARAPARTAAPRTAWSPSARAWSGWRRRRGALFPEARIAVFSSDTVFDAREARRLIEAMAAGEIDILVATQAAAKGHNFPKLTLVGVVDADLGLRGGDLRAAERTYQLLAQATGRAGRRDRPGRALLQTYAPEHAVMQALKAQDRDAFVAAEMAERELAGLPPFGRLAAVIASGPGRGPAGRLHARHGRRPRPTPRAWRSTAPPTRRSAWSAAAAASASWSAPTAASTSRPTWPPGAPA